MISPVNATLAHLRNLQEAINVAIMALDVVQGLDMATQKSHTPPIEVPKSIQPSRKRIPSNPSTPSIPHEHHPMDAVMEKILSVATTQGSSYATLMTAAEIPAHQGRKPIAKLLGLGKLRKEGNTTSCRFFRTF